MKFKLNLKRIRNRNFIKSGSYLYDLKKEDNTLHGESLCQRQMTYSIRENNCKN